MSTSVSASTTSTSGGSSSSSSSPSSTSSSSSSSVSVLYNGVFERARSSSTSSRPSSSSSSSSYYWIASESTKAQNYAELECQQYFIPLNTLPESQLIHLQQSGLLLLSSPSPPEDEVMGEEVGVVEEKKTIGLDLDHCILLLRKKHIQYLSQIWQTSPSYHQRPPLRSGFVSLDASRPWILYWCLHGYDLLSSSVSETPTTTTKTNDDNDLNQKEIDDQEQSYIRMVQTMEKCWQSTTVTLSDHICTEWLDQDPLIPEPIRSDTTTTTTTGEDDQQRVYPAGGFGGGPGQIAHAATTYAGILALCIIATNSTTTTTTTPSKSKSSSSTSSSKSSVSAADMALTLLKRIRPMLYTWMLSLQQSDGSYRMHLDGEVDVRATYTIFACAKLLNLLDMRKNTTTTSTTSSSNQLWEQRRSISQLLFLGGPKELAVSYLIQCQTYEGGMGSEPFVEAHGGYTFCATAALQLIHKLSHPTLDIDNLLRWLVQRQMSYEGGFSGRTNKLVDACYSFWQASALAIVCQQVQQQEQEQSNRSNNEEDEDDDYDPWLHHQGGCNATTTTTTNNNNNNKLLLMDIPMLERYILLCSQDVNGGLRDKPSKQRDFYHSCYSLSGLSILQHYSGTATTGNETEIAKTSASTGGGGAAADSVMASEEATTTTTTTNTTLDQDKDDNKEEGQSDSPPSSSSQYVDWYGHRPSNWVAQTHPCYNIRVDRVQRIIEHFRQLDKRSGIEKAATVGATQGDGN